MRTITDNGGTRWDVTVGRESYGIQVLLFSPQSSGGVRKAALEAGTRLAAERELAALSEPDLLDRLDRSQPWESDSWTG